MALVWNKYLNFTIVSIMLFAFIKPFRTFLTVFIILWITPQTSITYYNYVLNTMHSTRFFADYPAAKRFVASVTWFCIISYMITNFLLFV